jgi:HAE1 family hydrophobic/amphiphilic exporter-1
MPNDVYFQIGLLTVLGLTTKNAILIVQFARARVDEGARLTEATLDAAKLRLRRDDLQGTWKTQKESNDEARS